MAAEKHKMMMLKKKDDDRSSVYSSCCLYAAEISCWAWEIEKEHTSKRVKYACMQKKDV